MRTQKGISPNVFVPHAESPACTGNDATLTIDTVDAGTPLTMPHTTTEYSTGSLKRTALVSAGAGVLFVLVLTLGWHLTLGGRFYFVWFLWWFALHAWPIPLAVGLIIGATGANWIKLMGWYFIVFIALSAASLILYDNLKMVNLCSNALTILPIAVPVVGLLYRPIRAVGLLVFAFLLMVLVASPPLTLALMHSLVALLKLALINGNYLMKVPALILVYLLGPEGFASFLVLFVGAFTVLFAIAITCVLGWWTLNQIGRSYRRKRLSDQSLMLGSLWAVVALSHVNLLYPQQDWGKSWAWIVFPMAAFATYWLTQRTGLAVLSRPALSRGVAPMLLLLRVFSLEKRSERLFDVLTPHWLQTGSIAFIAGPDLATRTVQPHQFLEYLARRITRQFVKNELDLSCRLSELDLRPDPDGRHRVNQFFCFADTWQSAVRQLAQRTSAVLMDLRNFSEANQGCQYELGQILEYVPVGRILLIIDKTTDWPFLEATLNRLWATISCDSPNRAFESSHLRVFRLQSGSSREVHGIIQLIIDRKPVFN